VERWRWALVALVLLAVVVLAVVLASARATRRRTANGSEIESRSGSRPGSRLEPRTDIDLRDAQGRHIDLRALSDVARNRYVEEWIAIQERSVENPVQSVMDSEALLSKVLIERGYPGGDGEEHLELVCADHPRLAESLRAVSIVRHRVGGGLTSPEDLREAMMHYRLLFIDLLAEDDTVSGRLQRDEAGRRN